MLSPTGHCHAFDVAADGFVVRRGLRGGAAQAAAGCAARRRPDPGRGARHGRQPGRPHREHRRRRRWTRRSRRTGPRWPPPAWTPPPSAWSRRTAPAPRSVTRSNTPAWPRSTASTGPARSASAKTNFGHTQSAAGALGLMKAVLAVQHGVVPQNLHFTRLPDELARIETESLCAAGEHAVARRTVTQPRRAAVSSYGMSGTNVHAILEQAPEPAASAQHDGDRTGDRRARTAVSAVVDLGRRAAPTPPAGWPTGCDAQRRPWRCRISAYTLARRRGHRPVRTAVHRRQPRRS